MFAPKIVFFTKYGRTGASSRLRTYQYFDDQPVQYVFNELLSDRYVAALYRRKKIRFFWLILGYLKRVVFLLRIKSPEIVVVEKELFPWVPWVVEKFFLGKSKLVVDIDDAIFHNYDKGLRRRLLGGKFSNIFRRSSLVLAGNQYLGDYAIAAGATCVKSFPTVVSLDKYVKNTETSPGNTLDLPVIVWIGTPSTQGYLTAVVKCLDVLFETNRFVFRVIGANDVDYLKRPYVQIIKWDEATEASEIAGANIGIMPLPDRPFERGKCGYKLIQYMACGLPVVASPVGVNSTIVKSGENGFLCVSDEEWMRALGALLEDAKLRVSLGENGKALVTSSYSLETQRLRYFKYLSELA